MGDFMGRLVKLTNRMEPVRNIAAKFLISKFAKAVPPRPSPYSMFADYPTWPGLTERQFSTRHLPVYSPANAPAEPDLDKVAALFQRVTFTPAHDTSLLFPLFAQWFVDGFLRTKWEGQGVAPTFRENESPHEISLNQIYGSAEEQTRMLRDLGNGGRLKSRIVEGEEWPVLLYEEIDGRMQIKPEFASAPGREGLYTDINIKRIFGKWTDEQKRAAWATGLEHGSSTLGQAAVNALWLREHNRVAGILAKEHPSWDDERLFQTARNVCIVSALNIVMFDYIPHVAQQRLDLRVAPGWAEKQPWYRVNWMTAEFALLYRWHDLIPDTFMVGPVEKTALDLLKPMQWLEQAGLGPVLAAASSNPAGRIGLHNTPAFLNAFEGPDVKRLSLRMSRTIKLPSYNAYREHYGMKRIESFKELTQNDETANELKALYGSIDKLEWFVGIFAEAYEPPAMMGELLMTMVAHDAFTHVLTNPLLSKRVYGEGAFGKEGLKIAEATKTVADLAIRNTTVTDRSKFSLKRV